MTLVTLFFLKYKYYIHHYITIILYSALGIIIDFIIEGYKIIDFKYAYIYIIYILDDVMVFCYMKYMMDKLYYQYKTIIIYHGIMKLIIDVGFMAGFGIYEYKNEKKGEYRNILTSIQKYFETASVAAITLFQIIFFLIIYGFKNIY